MTHAHGLVIGKFHPPHAGHHHLVRTAAAACGRVSVVVMAASHESLPLADRVRWMREVHADTPHVEVTGIVDDVPMDLASASIWAQHVQLMRAALAAIAAPPVTAVFTAESYGEELARRFEATPVTLDPARTQVPVSATRIRADVPGHWDFLAPPVRAGLALRVVVLGAESTGTSTLAAALAEALRARGGAFALTRCVPEYGRAYSEEKLARARAAARTRGGREPAFAELPWTSDEFVHIAGEQLRRQRAAAAEGGPVLVGDTDAFATGVWHERYVGTREATTERIGEEERAHLYLLTHDAGVPFVQDGLRDGEAIRGWMTQRFLERLRESGRRHVVLEGPHPERLARALREVDALLSGAWKFAAPPA